MGPDENKLKEKRGKYSKPWQESPATLGEDGDDEAEEDLLDGGSLKVSGLGEVKNKRRKRIGRFKNRTVQDDINRAGERLKQRLLREQHEEERKRLRSRELRASVRARFIATENRRKAHAATSGGKNFKAHESFEAHDYSANAPKRYMATTAGNQSSLIIQHQEEVYAREVEFEKQSVIMMETWTKPLKWLYYMYAHADCGMLVKEETFYEQKMSGLQIGIREWQILCRDFLITPCMGTVKENSNHYHSANISMKTEGDKLAMEFDEFCCAFRHIAREAPCLQEIPSEEERILAMMSFMRRQACIVDKNERGTLKNRRMGDRRHWTSKVIPMIEWRRTIPAHFGFTPQSVMVMEILDDLVFDTFGVHTLPNVPVPWNKETWDDPPKKWVPKTTVPDDDSVIRRNYLVKQPPPEPKKSKYKGFTSSARRFRYQAKDEDKVTEADALNVRVRRFGDSALKQLPLKWLRTGKICVELLDKLIGDVMNGNARGRLKQRYGQMDKYKVELKEYNDALKNSRRSKFVKLPWGKETIVLRAPILPPKETEKVIDKLKRENELERLKNIKRERNRKMRQKELQEQLADIAKQKEREKKKMKAKKEVQDEKRKLKEDKARALEAEKRREDKQKVKEWRAERDAESAHMTKAQMLDKQRLAAKNKDAVERINNKYHWEQARKEKARKEQEAKEAKKNSELKKRMDQDNKRKKEEMAAKSKQRRAEREEEEEAAAKIQALYRGKADRQKLEEENADYKEIRKKQRKKKKRRSRKK